jgi:A-type KR domain-containing polyene macrolide polyketide synthase
MTLDTGQDTSGEPVAIVGMACRLPGGADSPERLWELVPDGGSSEAGPLSATAGLDAALFGLSPEEARRVDPQRRLLLETTWEAFERAGIPPSTVSGRRTGVFAVVSAVGAAPQPGTLTNGRAAGFVAAAMRAGGPTVTAGADSAPLAALHLAVQSLRHREATFAIVCGVTSSAGPEHLAPSEQNTPPVAGISGDEAAEGVTTLLLEPLSDAVRRGHRTLAIIRGCALGRGGSADAHRQVVVRTLADAGLDPADVGWAEAPGGGAEAVDAEEIRALAAVYGRERTAGGPRWPGAGGAAVIKAVCALEAGALPAAARTVPATGRRDDAVARPWPGSGPRRAGLSARGADGTTIHVLLEEPAAPASPGRRAVAEGALAGIPWLLSAADRNALRDRVRQLLDYLGTHPGTDPKAVGHTLAARREHLPVRLAVADHERAAASLAKWLDGSPVAGLTRGTADLSGRTVFVFPGQGAQWPGMGARLLETSPPFRRALDECAASLLEHTGWSPIDVLRGAAGAPSLDRIDVVQPVTFAVMVGLAAVWRHLGIVPDAVVGHSQGEVAAGYVAGALSLPDAARIIALRSQAIARELAGHGAMVSVSLPPGEVTAALAGLSGHIGITAVNGPASVVVGGDIAAVEEFQRRCAQRDARVRRIATDTATHTSNVERIRTGVLGDLVPLRPKPPSIPMYSPAARGWIEGPALDADFWYANLREPVYFHEAVRELVRTGHSTFLEVSAHPILTTPVQQTLDTFPGLTALAVGSLRKQVDERRALQDTLLRLHVRGVPVDWAALYESERTDALPLPPYPFQHGAADAEGGPAGR